MFGLAWLKKLKEAKWWLVINYMIIAAIYFLAISTDWIISLTHMRRFFWGLYPVYSIGSIVFLAHFLVQAFIGYRNLYRMYHCAHSQIEKKQIGLIMVANLIGFTACADFVSKYTSIAVYPYGYISLFIFISLVAYSIVRYRTFDIETVFHKTLMWFFTSLLSLIPAFVTYKLIYQYLEYSFVLQILFWFTGFSLFAYYLRVIQPKIDHAFQRRRYNLEDIAGRFTEDLVHLKGVDQLIERLHKVISETLYPQTVDVFLFREKEKQYTKADRADFSLVFPAQDSFFCWLSANNKILYRDFVDIDPLVEDIRVQAKNYFSKTNAALVVPFVLNNSLLGFINLGKKNSLRRYNAADFHFLTILKNQAAIAISNSLVYENIEEQVRQRTHELVQTQEQLIQAEKLATVGTLAGGVAHEINNPLTAILTNVQFMLSEIEGEQGLVDRESLELMEQATQRCREIVKKLMLYARKPMTPEKEVLTEVDLGQVLKSVSSLLNYQLAQENINLEIVSSEPSYKVLGVKNEFEQVITNLILNARDAIKMVKKSGTILLTMKKDVKQAIIEVKDEGEGISQENISKIFDPFFTTKEVGKGVGLGLSICQSIIQKYNGQIKVFSVAGKGTTFTIYIPKVKEKKKI